MGMKSPGIAFADLDERLLLRLRAFPMLTSGYIGLLLRGGWQHHPERERERENIGSVTRPGEVYMKRATNYNRKRHQGTRKNLRNKFAASESLQVPIILLAILSGLQLFRLTTLMISSHPFNLQCLHRDRFCRSNDHSLTTPY